MLRHDNIIRYYGQRMRDNLTYLFLEYADGGELFDRIGLPLEHYTYMYVMYNTVDTLYCTLAQCAFAIFSPLMPHIDDLLLPLPYLVISCHA